MAEESLLLTPLDIPNETVQKRVDAPCGVCNVWFCVDDGGAVLETQLSYGFGLVGTVSLVGTEGLVEYWGLGGVLRVWWATSCLYSIVVKDKDGRPSKRSSCWSAAYVLQRWCTSLLEGFLGVSRSAARAFLVFFYPSFLLTMFFIIVFVLGLYLVSFYIQFCVFFLLVVLV